MVFVFDISNRNLYGGYDQNYNYEFYRKFYVGIFIGIRVRKFGNWKWDVELEVDLNSVDVWEKFDFIVVFI